MIQPGFLQSGLQEGNFVPSISQSWGEYQTLWKDRALIGVPNATFRFQTFFVSKSERLKVDWRLKKIVAKSRTFHPHKNYGRGRQNA